jgi:hypothetical protein
MIMLLENNDDFKPFDDDLSALQVPFILADKDFGV